MKWLRLIVPVLLLGLLWHLADGEKAWARLRAADPAWLILAFAALHAQTILSALRWRQVAHALGQPITKGQALREYYVAQVVNQTLPGGVIGDGARAVRAAAPGALPAAVAAVVLERALGQAALLGVLLMGFVWSVTLGRIDWPTGSLPLGLLAIVALLLALRFMAIRATGLRQIIGSAFNGQQQRRRLVLSSLAIVALNLAAFATTAQATGTAFTIEAALTLIPLILTAMLIPLSIGGWGWREGAAAALFPLAGSTPDAGLVASATYGVLILMASLPGAIWLARPKVRPTAE
ncbi:MAG: lysylphosphatidylglycerol synthase transmembrane domain-containing protein [Paracoccaceae bacterium]